MEDLKPQLLELEQLPLETRGTQKLETEKLETDFEIYWLRTFLKSVARGSLYTGKIVVGGLRIRYQVMLLRPTVSDVIG